MGHLLIVDDEPSICWGIARLAGDLGHTASVAASAEQALAAAASPRPDLILLDVRLPGMDGLTAIDALRERLGGVPIVVMTAYGDLSIAVEAVRKGAFDYLVKPFELSVVERAIQRAFVGREAQKAPSVAPENGSSEGRIVGSSKAMQEVFKRIAVVAPTTACVHLRGESGTGKELVARAIHRFSGRASGPFIAVNIAALSPSLAESELFGHARGAFTGADHPHTGLLERAHGGTLFIDEVADIPLALQVKLLRVLEYGEVLPVGAAKPVRCDFRVISATHQNLSQRVTEGAFRHDLYFRLVTFEIEIPPLRDRREDIRELTDYFLEGLAARNGCSRPPVPESTHGVLQQRSWWGNVRELRNALEHAMILARGGPLLAEHLPPPMPPTVTGTGRDEMLASMVSRWTEAELQRNPDGGNLHQRLLQIVEPPLFEAVLERHHGQYLAAARQLGLHRVTLKKKMDEVLKKRSTGP
ncbi:MAG: sigma-54 dependent transcriptional regulator [Thermoguttaceae bacterium]|jgi:two-component system nitrogen regulation response regulator GlnG|nr:sigma-54 dependent transcriptional regulator [Thermoguttaceae bacterium]